MAAAVATVTTFGPWGGSGQSTRSSYALVDIAGRAGVVPASVAGMTWIWYLVPVLCGLAFVGAAAHRPRAAGAFSTTLGALVVTAAVLVSRSPLVVEAGAVAGGFAGAATMMTGAATVVVPWRRAGQADERRVGSHDGSR